jgi:chromosome segregation ATPase
LTRVLRRDGKYWFEVDGVAASKADVLRLLSRFNVDPDNMLIIMHQDMAEQFVLLSPQEKLRLVESAVGLESYRRNVLDARSKLSHIISQEESLNKMLEAAEQTLNYWREQYERYQDKKQLTLKRRFLERELMWAEVSRMEEEADKLRREAETKRIELGEIESSIKELEENAKLTELEITKLREDLWKLFDERIMLEREKTKYSLESAKSSEIIDALRDFLREGEAELERLFSALKVTMQVNDSKIEDSSGGGQVIAAVKIIDDLSRWFNTIKSKVADLENLAEISSIKLANLEIKLLDVKDQMHKVEKMRSDLTSALINSKVNLAVLNYRRNELLSALETLDKSLSELMLRINEATKKAEERGPRIAVSRKPEDILSEMRIIDGRLIAMVDVNEDAEKMYESYSKLYLEIKEKARIAAENREKTLEEIKVRMESWKSVIKNILESVNVEYQNVLSQVAGSGFVRLVNENDIEAAGLEIYVGFKGSQPIPLNIYSQSGGERSTATMAFLLALQKHIKSPFRAIDEYDVHMDPRNREVIANLLVSAVEGEGVQYLAITPNQMFFEGKNVHVITVQNIDGKSFIREVS